MRRTYQYRLYPNRTQTPALDLLLWQGRTLYNAALEQRITTYRATGKGITYPAQWAHFRDLRHATSRSLIISTRSDNTTSPASSSLLNHSGKRPTSR